MNNIPEAEQFTPHSITKETLPRRNTIRKLMRLGMYFVFFAFLLALFAAHEAATLNQPDELFPLNQPITISEGMSVKDIATILESENIIRSSSLLYYVIVFFHDPTAIKASTYIFEEPLKTTEIAKRLTEGDFDTDLIRFTHFEGERATKIAKNAAKLLPDFNEASFIEIAEPYEGRLYPDTYLIPATYTDTDLFALLQNTFDERVLPIITEASSTFSTDDILTLASIIEREANTPESMRLVSSVLQNRLEIGMALQADASIEYILDKPLAELTPKDLDIDSPYNTYLYPGLPPTPIGNPGLDAIMAVLEPAKSDYFYYITDEEGEFHYARTYQEHLQNIEAYLR